MTDLLIVGAGLTAATICSLLKNKYKIIVIDTRYHIAGNCYDYKSNNEYIHKYGPHIFHSPNNDVVNLLSQYTEWIPYTHKVTAQLENGLEVPFPYSEETESILKRKMDLNEIIDVFFKPYSQKMWGKPWDQLSDTIKNRIPKISKTSDYFSNQFTAFPKFGYTKMIEKMFDGVTVLLGVTEDYWKTIDARQIIFTGRPDRILVDTLRVGDYIGWLSHRNLKFNTLIENWNHNTNVVNFCHFKSNYTRKSSFGGIKSDAIVTYELPISSNSTDIAPYYPFIDQENRHLYTEIKKYIDYKYPNIILGGRLGTYTYLDMWNVVLNGIQISKKISN